MSSRFRPVPGEVTEQPKCGAEHGDTGDQGERVPSHAACRGGTGRQTQETV